MKLVERRKQIMNRILMKNEKGKRKGKRFSIAIRGRSARIAVINEDL